MTEQAYGEADSSTMTTVGHDDDNVTNDSRESESPRGESMATDNGSMSTDNGSMSTDNSSMATNGGSMSTDSGSMATDGDSQLLFDQQDAMSFRQRWEQVQSRFVDDPRAAVADADALVSDVTQSLTNRFADQRSGLEQQWSQGEDVQTEDLRQTMQRYRTLFERLLAA